MSLPRTFPFFLFIPFFLLACEKGPMGDCLKGRGKTVVRERPITGIRSIELRDHIELRIVKAQEEKLEVRAGKKLIDRIKTEKEGERLRIRDLNSCDWVRSYDKVPRVTVHTKRLERIENRSTADISMEGRIEGERFRYDQWNGMGEVELKLKVDTASLKLHTGAGSLRCLGFCDRANLYLGGPGFLHLEDLVCDTAWAHNKGAGDIHLQVAEELRAEVQGVGSVLYEGKGELVSEKDEGEGRIQKVN